MTLLVGNIHLMPLLFPGFVAVKENEPAGHGSSSVHLIHDSDAKTLIDSRRDSPLTNKLLSCQASDTDSIGMCILLDR